MNTVQHNVTVTEDTKEIDDKLEPEKKKPVCKI